MLMTNIILLCNNILDGSIEVTRPSEGTSLDKVHPLYIACTWDYLWSNKKKLPREKRKNCQRNQKTNAMHGQENCKRRKRKAIKEVI
ncbi:hypothetical protein WA026_013140 [Henosepilachna vigintioctopunctata]|uniref:Uncharacterized protein n=1 Tax=Henosepilachna vigintioctopunctata TaxID=420089 RepID=A0AAW1UAR9_9CUCU